ncbi:MAG: HEAT repeat domain-containing protein, partial [Verrucomicrobiota bacterium]
VRHAVVLALADVGGKESVEILKRIAEHGHEQTTDPGEFIKREAVRSLQKIEALKSGKIQDLIQLATTHENYELRFWAIDRLGRSRDDKKARATLFTIMTFGKEGSDCSSYLKRAAAKALKTHGLKILQHDWADFELVE